MTYLELLPNELLHELFKFFNVPELFRIFHGLNSRFNDLLRNHFKSYHLDLRSVSKNDFDTFCDEYLLQIIDQIIALRLSNDDDTPQQIERFLSHDNLLGQFTRLQEFSLYHVRSEIVMNQISFHLQQLPTLTHLNIIQCCLRRSPSSIFDFINAIWSLPNLIQCNLDIYLKSEEYFIVPISISPSLEHVNIGGLLFDCDQINLLFERTPRLRYLKIQNIYFTEIIHPIPNAASLAMLNFSSNFPSADDIQHLLQSMTNLSQLTVDIYGLCVDGYQWEKIIHTYLPNLKRFRLREQIVENDQNQGEAKMDALLKSFQTKFWLKERRWFIRCDWNLTDSYSLICLYTLPYSFIDFTTDCLFLSKSTSPHDLNNDTYRRVQKLWCNGLSTDDKMLAHLYFPSVRHLASECFFHNHFRSMLLKLEQLDTMNLSLSDNDPTALTQWQNLLYEATNLTSLTINASSSSVIMLFIQNLNLSVRRLNLNIGDQWFDGKQCSVLINVPLLVQCKVLTIRIKDCNSVLDLVNNLSNLRILRIQCEDDQPKFHSLSFGQDYFVRWLQKCLPSTCYVLRDLYSIDVVYLWIR